VGGRYRLRTVLGSGGMGAVWLASDELLDRDVAVKEIFWPTALDEAEREKLRQRALREARTAARIDHPNIIGVFDVVEEDERPWIVMQLARYPSLSEAVREEGRLPQARVAHIGLEILAAISAGHAAGVLHRDVKPSNVLLGPDDQVVLTDFGMAVADGSPALTTSNVLIGSPSYMAPERARGLPGTRAGDLWSLGATLYTAVEGRPPFDREGAMAVLTAVVADDPDPPQHAGGLWPAISGLLRKDPQERLSAAETEALLRRIADPGHSASTPLEEPTSPMSEDIPPPSPDPAALAAIALKADDVPGQPSWPRRSSGDRSPRILPRPRWLASRWHRPRWHRPRWHRPRWHRPRWHRPRWLTIAVAVAGVAVLASAVAIPLVFAHSPAGRSASGSHRAAAPAASHTADTPPAPKSTSSPKSSPTQSDGALTGLPAGWVWYHDPTGFSIGMPHGWQVTHRGVYIYIQDPSSADFLIIDQTTHPQPNALEDWRQQEAARRSTFADYHLIRLQAVSYPQAEQAADWEFTFDQGGQPTHVLNRNILVDSHHACALYWSTPADQWSADYHLFEVFAASFHPVGDLAGS
jgi:eukaryotic-like serine/threonine-protein kinase